MGRVKKKEQMKEPLYILDVYAFIYRSYFAFIARPLRNPEGKNVSAIYGFFKFLFALFADRKPEAFVAALDSKGPTFRHELYTKYKATRQKTPEDLIAQVPMVEQILTALKVPLIRKEGFEADDVIASLARRCAAEERPCYIVSGDKDLLQLVGGSVKALRPATSFDFREVDSDGVRAEWGVSPVRILDYLSLVGDSSDNIPGVNGIGDKTAQKLLAQFDGIDELYARIEEVQPESLRKKLEAGKEDAFFSRRLVTLADNLDVGITSLEELCLPKLDRENAAPLFIAQGMRSLVPPGYVTNAGKSESRISSETLEPGIQTHSSEASNQTGLFDFNEGNEEDLRGPGTYETVKDSQGLANLVSACIRSGTCAFDTEVSSLDSLTADLIGFSLSYQNKKAYYIPLRSPDSDVLPLPTVVRELTKLFSSETLVIGHNIKFDMHVLRKHKITMPAKIFDTMIAAWLIDAESNSFSLGALSEQRLGISGLAFEDVVTKGSTFESVGIQTATRYSGEDADFTYRLHTIFERELERSHLVTLFRDIEMPLVPILEAMEAHGILVNAPELRKFGLEIDSNIEELQGKVRDLVGHDFNLSSTKQLQDVLFVERKLPPQKRTKTGYSTDTSVLEELAPLDPVPELILRHRTLLKLKSTYVEPLAALAENGGRIHTTYLQTGAATGRLSSKDPNLQNIPIRDEEGRKIRAAFVAAPGAALISADYSQIELVVMAHLSEDENLCAAFREGVDIHRRTAAFIFGVPEDKIDSEKRRVAKTINFGVIYGMSAYRLARDLGIPNSRAQEFIDNYFSTYSGIARFIAKTIAETESTGYSTTLFGRRRMIPAINSANKTERQAAQRVAVNTPIQGTAADIVKIAMICVNSALRKELPEVNMLLQVHDELVFEAPERLIDAASALAKREMEGAASLRIPLRVSIESAQSWGAMH
jgi:DNA polymerase-1